MKRAVSIVWVLTVAVSLTACGASTVNVNDDKIALEPIECVWPDAPEIERPAPTWVCDEPVGENTISAVGIGRSTPATDRDPALKKQIAQADARRQLADQLKIKVQNMFNEAKTVTGIADGESYDLVTESVSSQITDQVLNGSRPIKSTMSPKKTQYVLMVLDAKTAGKVVQEAVETSFQNEKALWQIANGQRLKDEMQKRIEEMKAGS